MKKKSKILIFLILLILIVAVVINIGKALIPSYEEMYKGSWGFSFPSNLKYAEIYEKDTGSSFHGDGYRYHVYTYEVEDGIAEMVEWHNTEGHTKYFPSYYEAVENWLTEIKAEKEQYPIYENANYYYQWREDNSELILIWNSQEKKIYILESFM